MKTTRLWLAALFVLLLVSAPGMAADAKNTAVSDSSPVMVAWQRRIPRFEFDRMKLSEVAAHLRQHFPEVNFIVPDSAAAAEVNVVLRSVTLSDILKAIELASEGHILATVPGAQMAVDPAGLPVPNSSGLRSNLVSFAFYPEGLTGPVSKSQVATRVFHLASYLAGRSDKEADEAIGSLYQAFAVTWEMLKKYERNVEPPSLNLHEGTKLLIAVGREKELAVVEQIIRELQDASKAKPSVVPDQNSFRAPVSKPPAPPKP